MTGRLFWKDSCLTELDTTVATVAGDQVTLDATISFTFAGGQECDAGSIAGPGGAEARPGDRHRLPEDHGLQPGDPAHANIDWDRRFRLMRLHFAAGLVLELVYRELPGVEKLGVHIFEDKARIDFAWPMNVSPLFPTLLEKVRSLVGADLSITSAFPDGAAERRPLRCRALPGSPAGAPLRRTGEVGCIELRRRNVGGGKERIEITVP